VQDLQADPYDEKHKKHIQEVLKLQPPRKPGIDRRRGLCNTRVMVDEGLYSCKLTRTLCDRDQDDQRRGADRNYPQGVDPALTDANPRCYPPLRRQPMIQPNTIVCVAECCLKRVRRRRKICEAPSWRLLRTARSQTRDSKLNGAAHCKILTVIATSPSIFVTSHGQR
jgi:hypothetical protein